MRTNRLAIICLTDIVDPIHDEIKSAGRALYTRYTVLRPKPSPLQQPATAVAVSPGKVLFVHIDLGLISHDSDFNPAASQVSTYSKGGEFYSAGGTLGVYLVAHGMNGAIPQFGPNTFLGILEHLRLKDVSKLSIVSCGLATRTDFTGTDESSKSILYDLCKFLAEKGIEPRIAGWTDFVTVVHDDMWDKTEGGLGKKVKANRNSEIDYTPNIGRKAANSSKSGALKGKLALVDPQTRMNQKLLYVYRNGVTELDHANWTDKPHAL